MDVTLLGTGSPIPDADRAGPATLVRAGGAVVLVDAGRGVAMRLAAAGLFPVQLTAVLLTHLHSDHISDLNDVVTTRWVMASDAAPLPVYGPPGTAAVVEGMLAMLGPDIGYRLAHHDDLAGPPRVEVREVGPGETFDLGGATVRVGRTDHRPVEPTVAYRFEHGGSTVVLGGDGVPCEELTELCRDADVYVQTAVHPELVRQVGMPRFTDILDYHSSVEDAARTAATAGVGTLVLTHFVPAIAPGDHEAWRALATPHFAGEVVLPDDGHTIHLGT